MEEHLIIRDFGPIREARIALRDLTILVGPQATGKSLAAQALYFLREVDALSSSPLDEPCEAVLSALESWFGNRAAVYVKPGTRLAWTPAGAPPEATQEIVWDESGAQLGHALLKRVQAIQAGQALDQSAKVYIPAGRALYSFLPPYSLASRVVASEEWPGYILKFYETLGRSIRWLWQAEDAPEDTPGVAFLRSRIDSIIKGRIQYGPDAVMLETAKKRLRSTTIAAGQMEIWPFWAIVETGIRTQRLAVAQIYFEEPEAHLHPRAQRDVMEMVAYLVRQGTRFLLTTHSPYILYAVNNFLMAQKVLAHGQSLPPDVPSEIALSAKRVAAYRFSADGTVHDIMDQDVGLIDEDELDDVADALGTTFTRLQERLGGAE